MSINLEAEVRKHGLEISEVKRQLNLFKKGVEPVRLNRPATISDGIIRIDDKLQKELITEFEYSGTKLKPVKFIPASGAASRMFKNLQGLLNTFKRISDDELARDTPESRFAKLFIDGITSFAFWDELKQSLEKDGLDAEKLLEDHDYRPLIEYTLSEKGLNYAALPKALIQFHDYGTETRTSLEEHFVEGLKYSRDDSGKVRLHFTVSPEFEDDVHALIEKLITKYADDNTGFDIQLSFQDPSTDTIAVDEKNEPFLDDDGHVLFRPGGHGALLSNLNQIQADIIFIKNIDNVVPDGLKPHTYTWKKVLGGYLCRIREQVFAYLNQLEKNQGNPEEMIAFCREKLNIPLKKISEDTPDAEIRTLLQKMLNRPIRVCGMVKNEGEPGGGPFWVSHKNGKTSLQIVETSQVDLKDDSQYEILQSATHFNPVDIVCTTKNFRGKAFELDHFADPDTAFIADKSYSGRKLKALERPGLWNGAMADWITIFAEVPIETFNPVKTVNDLLRPQHQAEG